MSSLQSFKLIGGGYREGGRPEIRSFSGESVKLQPKVITFGLSTGGRPDLRSSNVFGTNNRIPNIKEHISDKGISLLSAISDKYNNGVYYYSSQGVGTRKRIQPAINSIVVGSLDPFPTIKALNNIKLHDIFGKSELKQSLYNIAQDSEFVNLKQVKGK